MALAVLAARLMLGGATTGQSGPQGICLCPSCDARYIAQGLQGTRYKDFPSDFLKGRTTFFRHKAAAVAGGFPDVEPWFVWLDAVGDSAYQPMNRTTTHSPTHDGDPMEIAVDDDEYEEEEEQPEQLSSEGEMMASTKATAELQQVCSS